MDAIPVVYKNHLFRSTLEGKCAVFFDRMGLGYQYEPRKFETPLGWYLPDFFFYKHGVWVEVKPEHPSEEEFEKLKAVDEQVDGVCCFLVGFPRVDAGGLCNSVFYTANGNMISAHQLHMKFPRLHREKIKAAITMSNHHSFMPETANEFVHMFAKKQDPKFRYKHHDKVNQQLIDLGAA